MKEVSVVPLSNQAKSLEEARVSFRRWMWEAALPYWAEHGVDRRDGGFVERLSLVGSDDGAPFKRVRVQARQIYVFAHASLLGWPGGEALAERGWGFLQAHARRGDGSWVRSLSRDGSVVDASADTYDIAFVLFAHAWLYRLAPSAALRTSALETLDVLDRTLRHPSGLGWWASDDRLSCEQNPQMHMLEAMIELADATGHERFRETASQIITLFLGNLFDRRFGVVREYYDSGWEAPDPMRGHIVEPGHLFEWSWLLRRAARLLGVSSGGAADILYAAARRGEHPDTGLIVDRIHADGRILSAGCRLWPQTEGLKAQLVAFVTGDSQSLSRALRSVGNILERYLACKPAGCWIDQIDENLKPSVGLIPSSSFYHIFSSFGELTTNRLENLT